MSDPQARAAPTPVDVLADVVRTLGATGMVLACGRYPHPFGVALEGRSEAGFHLIVAGACWLRRRDAAPLQLLQGDLLLMPRGDAHELVSAPDGVARPLAEQGRPGPLPIGVPSTTILCGAYCLDAPSVHPLLLTLPRSLHLPAARVRAHAGLAGVLDLLTREVAGERLGSDEVVRHLIDLLLYYVLRAVAEESSTAADRGFVGALADPLVGAELRQLQGDPARGWTVEELARRVGASRAAFARHFTEVVGEPPLAYLTRWRMSRAASLLRSSEKTVHEIAGQVGYQSEFAFSRAFKRHLGVPPTSYRRGA